MYSQPHYQPTGYSSLNNSGVFVPTPTHARTQSTNKIPPAPIIKQQFTRAPSQKKLTLTYQAVLPLTQNLQKQPEQGLKKRGGDFFANKGKYISLQSSRVAELQSIPTKRQREQDGLTELKRTFRDKLRELETAYAQKFKEYSNQVRQLQITLLSNARELEAKEKKIQELSNACKNYQEKLKNQEKQDKSCFIFKKINDLESKLRVLATYNQSSSDQQNNKIDQLTRTTINYFGKKLQNLKSTTNNLLSENSKRIFQLENQLEQGRYKQEKRSQGTRQSMESFGSQPPSFSLQTHQQQQFGMSFWDDCFFYPSEHSEDFQFIVQMTKRRDQPLHCWIDEYDYLRYADTSSYLFNLKGDRIKLIRCQIQELVSQKLMMIV